jgi:hypothetical protein
MTKLFGLDGSQEPTLEQVHEQQGRRPSTVEVVAEQTRRKSVDNRIVTGAAALTTRQSIVPVALVTTRKHPTPTLKQTYNKSLPIDQAYCRVECYTA